jgi:hypothetical protein
MLANWKLTGKGGAVKSKRFPCVCFPVKSKIMHVPCISHYCRYVHKKLYHPCWKCYHFKVVDAEQLGHLYVEHEILLDWLNLTPEEEAIGKYSKMYLHNAIHAGKSHWDIHCLSCHPSTNHECSQFASAIIDEL